MVLIKESVWRVEVDEEKGGDGSIFDPLLLIITESYGVWQRV